MRRKSSTFYLFDVAFLANSRWRQLAKRLPDDDDFNSAVGAYHVALAAARSNGFPDIDVYAETHSRFIGDLVEVGLLTPTGFPLKPWGEYAPSRPSYPSDKAAPSAPNVPKTPRGSSSSPPLPSNPINTPPKTENGTNRAGANDSDDPLDVYWQLTGRYPSSKAKAWVETLVETYGARNVSDAIATAYVTNPRTFLGLADDLLKRAATKAEQAERERAEREKRAARGRPHAEPERIGADVPNLDFKRKEH